MAAILLDQGVKNGHGLVVVAFGQGRGQLGLGFLRGDEDEAGRRGVGGGRAPLHQVVQFLQQAGRDRLVEEGVLGTGGTEQLVKRSIVEHVGHEASENTDEEGIPQAVRYRIRCAARSAKAGSVECRDCCNTQQG